MEKNTVHKMRLNNEPFESIDKGLKTIELRLNDEKRRKIKVDDLIEFTNNDTKAILIVKVEQIYHFSNFNELYKKIDKLSIGYMEKDNANPRDMEKYYSNEEQLKYGVLGIKIKKICEERNEQVQIKCDGIIHNPLGGASYMFDEIIPYLLLNLKKKKIKISVGAQVNSSPHFGTLETIALSFGLAKKIVEYDSTKEVIILYEIIETAPGETIIIDGIKYQKNLSVTGKIDNYIDEYIEILNFYREETGINYEIRYQREFNSSPKIREIISKILKNRKYISERLDPKYNNLRIRSSCPKCGLTDKNSVKNKYKGSKIIFTCPKHGEYTVDINKDTSNLEYNSPLRNLIRGILYTEINNSDEYDYQILRVTGSDYAGFIRKKCVIN